MLSWAHVRGGSLAVRPALATVILVRDLVAQHVRRSMRRITHRWEAAVRSLPASHGMSRPVLLDHLHELLDGLAAWVEGNERPALQAFETIIDGHALQRLAHSVGLETLLREYSTLRSVLGTELLTLPPSPQVHASIVRLHEGFDRATGEALRFYTNRRDEIRERFIAILGHDLRQPLSAISTCGDLLFEVAAEPPRIRELATRIGSACDRMQRMIGDVLDFARTHLGGGIPVWPAPEDMDEICRAAVAELVAAHPKQLVRFEARGDLRGAFDRDRVLQALGNLLGNALEHGSGALEVQAYEPPDCRAVIVEVTNHGPPIPAAGRATLFDPFTSSSPGRGLGLGLYIVQQIVRAHGGTCDVISDEHATTFVLCFPRGSAGTCRPALIEGAGPSPAPAAGAVTAPSGTRPDRPLRST